MDLSSSPLSPESAMPEGADDDVVLHNIRPTIEVAIAMDDTAYLRGWADAIRTVRAALAKGRESKADEYFEGWMDAVTLSPADAIRLTKTRSRYARGYTAGASEYDHAHRGDCDAE